MVCQTHRLDSEDEKTVAGENGQMKSQGHMDTLAVVLLQICMLRYFYYSICKYNYYAKM
jgi:hypothetical protein